MNSNSKPDKQRELITTVFCIIGLAIMIILLLSVFDVPSKIGLSCNDINWGIQGTLIGAIITIGLFVLTYLLIQRRDLQRQGNKQDIALFLLKHTYEDCLKSIQILENEKVFEAILRKTNFDAYSNDTPVGKLIKTSFPNESMIMQLGMEGVLTATQIETYLSVKDYYTQYMTTKVTFFDQPELWQVTRDLAKNAINEAIDSLAVHAASESERKER